MLWLCGIAVVYKGKLRFSRYYHQQCILLDCGERKSESER
jgi:hypothetical protein